MLLIYQAAILYITLVTLVDWVQGTENGLNFYLLKHNCPVQSKVLFFPDNVTKCQVFLTFSRRSFSISLNVAYFLLMPFYLQVVHVCAHECVCSVCADIISLFQCACVCVCVHKYISFFLSASM